MVKVSKSFNYTLLEYKLVKTFLLDHKIEVMLIEVHPFHAAVIRLCTKYMHEKKGALLFKSLRYFNFTIQLDV